MITLQQCHRLWIFIFHYYITSCSNDHMDCWLMPIKRMKAFVEMVAGRWMKKKMKWRYELAREGVRVELYDYFAAMPPTLDLHFSLLHHFMFKRSHGLLVDADQEDEGLRGDGGGKMDEEEDEVEDEEVEDEVEDEESDMENGKEEEDMEEEKHEHE
eukprot:TRINITY_DN5910_c0_g1_i2.p2 TRINITY_DN5910_c0_g1~~TRINITY_DN5910_c0_g1_i2.p2  ORF type:complete len:157 (+),score=66.37 TRINITY_DN5910_c0_g1_i2:438-908(+)